jgi:hypothetical protein
MLGIRVAPFVGVVGDDAGSGWNEAERQALQAKIADRQPFLDFVFSRVDAGGCSQQFQVSGEPMFNRALEAYSTFRRCGIDVLVAGSTWSQTESELPPCRCQRRFERNQH